MILKAEKESKEEEKKKEEKKKTKSVSENYLTNDKIHFVSVLVVLCLDAYVNVTFMPCKTELSLINHLVLYVSCQSSLLVLLYSFFLCSSVK